MQTRSAINEAGITPGDHQRIRVLAAGHRVLIEQLADVAAAMP